jgi:succinate-semialdehyde dehydrogenase/glutarate-semialdehyde dehydrogenase
MRGESMQLIDKLFINGIWVDSSSGKTYPVYNPATSELIGEVAEAGKEDTGLAIEAAESAFKHFRNSLPKERSDILYRMSELLISNREELSKIIVTEQGKSIHEARAEVDYTQSFFRWFAEEARRIYGDIVPSIKPGQKLFTFKEPIGVVAAITPWNFPAAMLARKIAPAIASGCTIVVKPSEETPFTATYMVRLLEQAGTPKGVVNLVSGKANEIGDTFAESNTVRMITFTGSTRVGKLLMEKASKTVKRVALELGGNAPFIVFADADLNKAADGLLASKLRNGGQSCICVNRVFVEEKVIGKFTEIIKEKFATINVGNGLDEKVNLGPLINRAATRKINMLVNQAQENGSELVFQAKVNTATECFYAPSIVRNYSDQVKFFTDEIFGPVVSLFSFTDEDEVIARANNTNYGLASYFYTENLSRIWRVSKNLEYGLVGANDVALSSEAASFGGVKESGIGREGGKDGINEYLEDKFLVLSY